MRTRGSTPTRIARSIALVSGLALLATACGNSAESGLEEFLEQQGGGDVEFDFDGDGGSSFQSEEGGISIDKDGSFVITGPNGEVIAGSADGEGNVTIESEGGGGTIETDAGTVIVSEEGEVITGNDEDGDINLESDDGSITITNDEEMPSEWPGDVPPPTNFAIATSSVIGTGDELLVGLIGQTSLEIADFVEDYGDSLISAGFEQASNFESDGNILRLYTNGTWDVSVTAFEGFEEDEPQILINLVQSS